MKKTLVAVLSLSALAFGVTAQAADSGYTPPVEQHVSKPGFRSPERKADRAANRALEKKVRVALTHTKGLDVSDITVLARKGAVTLVGTVPESQQIQLAQTSVQGLDGVVSLTNNLTERYPGH
ncbi:BON domain-containing protein [Trinickia diaoshuihuensis]|uniref:BON domain-containing protein n=1 Tax=Trinickia diaoshuihuensis TaxID=2292265 RepID=UPI000E27087C|nr:BON domain-containing protein [Trinickia diaoshuihuensis]